MIHRKDIIVLPNYPESRLEGIDLMISTKYHTDYRGCQFGRND